jgi:hypothetical protein
MTRASRGRGGNAPIHTQFKPGQSGNPSGRPKGRVSFQTLIDRELRKFVVITENGRSRRMTKKEVIIRRLAHEGIKGEYRAIELLLKLAGPERGEQADGASEDFTMPDKDALKIIAKRLRKMIAED